METPSQVEPALYAELIAKPIEELRHVVEGFPVGLLVTYIKERSKEHLVRLIITKTILEAQGKIVRLHCN